MPVIQVRNPDGSYSEVLSRGAVRRRSPQDQVLGSWLSSTFKKATGTKLSEVTKVVAPLAAGLIPGVGAIAAPIVGGITGGGGIGSIIGGLLGGGGQPALPGGLPNDLHNLTLDGIAKALRAALFPNGKPPPTSSATSSSPRLVELWQQLNWWRATVENQEDQALKHPLRHPGLPGRWQQVQTGDVPAGTTEAAMLSAIATWRTRSAALPPLPASGGGAGGAGLLLIGGLLAVAVVAGRKRR